MIAKGASRSGPRQLAVYLMRVERYETGEPVELLELQSPWAESLDDGSSRSRIASRLIETFRDWQTYTEGTKQGRDGLYHAEISPEAHYAATMTPEEWKRAADILGEEQGLQDQARALVLHGGTDGRKHLHVVWARTDIDAMKMISDSNNYLANERASLRMELEFGHEFVPGKHAKRDRELQPEFPRQKLTQDEDQQQKRTGLTVADRKAEIAALHAAADNAQAFKAALEDAGYLLAKGEKGYIVVDEAGGHSLVSRNLGLKKKEVDAYMAGVELDRLPTIEEAKALQREARQREQKSEALAEAQKPTLEASKFLTPPAAEKVPEPTPAPPVSKFLPQADAPAPQAPVVEPPAPVVAPQQDPDQPASKFLPEKETLQPTPTTEKPAGIDLTLYAPKAPAPTPPAPPAPVPPKTHEPVLPAPEPEAPGYDWTSKHITPEFKGLQPPEPPPEPKPKRPWEERDIVDLRRSIWKSQRAEYQEFADQNGRDYKQQGAVLDNENRLRMEDFDIAQRAALEAERERLRPEPGKGFRGMSDAIRRTLNPQDAEAVAAAKQEELALFRSQQAHDRREYIKTLEQNKRVELEKFREGQLAQQAQRERNYNEEIERRVAEYKEGKRLAAELEADQRQQQRDRDREGSASPTKRIQRSREPLPSDPWMAQIGGIDKLSPDHQASAQRSYEAWHLKDRYDFRDYVSYVQRQWEKIELAPAPQAAPPQPPKSAYDPAAYAPKPADWTQREITSKFNELQPPPEDPEIERRVREHIEAKRIAAELEADQREQELKREGPEPPEEGKE